MQHVPAIPNRFFAGIRSGGIADAAPASRRPYTAAAGSQSAHSVRPWRQRIAGLPCPVLSRHRHACAWRGGDCLLRAWHARSALHPASGHNGPSPQRPTATLELGPRAPMRRMNTTSIWPLPPIVDDRNLESRARHCVLSFGACDPPAPCRCAAAVRAHANPRSATMARGKLSPANNADPHSVLVHAAPVVGPHYGKYS